MTLLNYGDSISIYRYKSMIGIFDGTGRVDKRLVIEFDDNETIDDLIQKVKWSLYSALGKTHTRITKLGITFNHSNICHSAKPKQTVRELGIRHGEELPVTYKIFHDVRRIMINVRIVENGIMRDNKFCLYCEQDDKIVELKKQIEYQEGVYAYYQHLIIEGHLLDNNHTLMDYKIKNESTLFVCTRLVGGGSDFADMKKVNSVSFVVRNVRVLLKLT